MGVFGTVEIMIHCESKKSAEKVFEALTDEKMSEFIKENSDFETFHFGMDSIDSDSETVYVNISSGRVQNAEWQGEMVRDFLVANFKDDVYEITGEVTTPENFLWWNKEEE